MCGDPPSKFAFGPFVLDTNEHVLSRNGTPLSLTPKAFQTLRLLVQNSGKLVEKDELLKAVWPDSFVEEATLAQNIFTLRRILRHHANTPGEYIQTVQKRGYRFVMQVREITGERTRGSTEPVNIPRRDVQMDHRDTPAVRIDSIAVLPVFTPANDPRLDFLSDELTEAIVNGVTLFPGVKVKACSAVLRYKGRQVDPTETGLELNVDTLLIGKLLTMDESLIVRMELVEVPGGWQLWGEEYREKLSDVFEVREEIAGHVIEQLRLHLVGPELVHPK
ncbi:MAG TPA: winged helix-turn-helix domain-containing protein [Pyrinomonadaceae bacterium]|nr:winged helix-turn-helix domain-containing protein [Pyrinomonadaceae bacterium]